MGKKKSKMLVKANNDVLSFCDCQKDAFATSGQADCPWCGCGWLFTCAKCRKAFTFAKVEMTETTPERIAQLDYLNLWGRRLPADSDEIQEHAQWLRDDIKKIPVGTTCVYLDGMVLPVTALNIKFNGYYTSHELKTLPHVMANGSKEKLNLVLGDRDYWTDRELE